MFLGIEVAEDMAAISPNRHASRRGMLRDMRIELILSVSCPHLR